jgi:hypothetical protein
MSSLAPTSVALWQRPHHLRLGRRARPARLAPRGYAQLSYVAFLRRALVSGGIAGRDSIWRLQSLDLDSWRVEDVATTGAEPCGRHGHSLTAVGRRAFVFGGGTGGDILREGEDLTDLHCPTAATPLSRRPAPQPLPRKPSRPQFQCPR